MSTQNQQRYAPEPGLYPEFEEFVELNLAALDEQLRAEADRAWEWHPTRAWDEDMARREFRQWQRQRLADFRADLWHEWKWDHEGEGVLWKSAEVLEQENDFLRKQVADRDREIARLRRRNRHLRRQLREKEAAQQRATDDLRVERATSAQLRDARRCPDCDGPLY